MSVAVAIVVVLVAAAAGGFAGHRWTVARAATSRSGSTSAEAAAAAAPPDLQATQRADRLEAALDTITPGIIVTDAAGALVYQNPLASSLLAGRHGDAVVADEIEQLLAIALGGQSVERELRLFGPPRRTVCVAAKPIPGGERPDGAVVTIDDITESEHLDQMRRDFVTNISHELRTPVGAMSLLAETLADEQDPEVIENLASRLQAEAIRLGDTIDGLLELSRIEHDTDRALEPVVVQDVVAEAFDTLRAAVEQQGADVSIGAPAEPLVVAGDPRQLRSAVYCLLDNAVKYTEPDAGVVVVDLQRQGMTVEIAVHDNGIGIPRRDVDRVFERFYRVDRSPRHGPRGTGLGLAIVRHVAVNHGGHMSLESSEGKGSTFTLRLPLIDAGGDPGPRQPAPEAERRLAGGVSS